MWGALQQNYSDNDRIEHGLRTELVLLLDPPEAVNAYRLSRDANEQDVGQCERIVLNDFVLKSGDDGHGSIEGVAEKEVACAVSVTDIMITSIAPLTDKVEETLFKSPDLRDGTV